MNQNSKRGSAHAALITSTKMSNNHHQVSSSSKDNNKTPNKTGQPANTYRKESAPLARNNDNSLELSPINVLGENRKK